MKGIYLKHRLLAFLTLLLLLAFAVAPTQAVQVGNDEINFVDVLYDTPAAGESTWYYQVISGSAPAISHVVFELNLDCLEVIDAGTWDGMDFSSRVSGGGAPVVGIDPTTSITGIKFDEPFSDGETRYYYFTVDGNLAEDDVVTVASKGGAGYDTALITGPSTTCSPLANPAIDIEKTINGEDADTAPGVVLSEGDAITFEFVVTNTGDVDLTDVLVTDDVLGAICGVGFLEVGDTFTCSIGGVTAAAGQHTNTGTSTGSYGSITVSDSDPANYYGEPLAPQIDIEKFINGEDADMAPGPMLSAGDAVTFEFVVTNTGDFDLTDVLVTDDVLGAICGVGSLGVGETFTCTISTIAGAGQHTNTGTATASYNDAVVSDSDPANYYTESPTPQIDIEKYINGDDADLAPGVMLTEGDAVTFEFIVTNTGNVSLLNAQVTDDVLGPICGVGSLGVGETFTCTIGGLTAAAGQHTNTGTVSASYNNNMVSDSDPANYYAEPVFVPNPALDLEKFTNGQDVAEAPGPSIPVGSLVTWDYVVTNTGNVTLENIQVWDNMIGQICVIGSLAPGETAACSATGTAIEGQYMNIGKVITFYGGTPKTGINVKDIDRSYYVGVP